MANAAAYMEVEGYTNQVYSAVLEYDFAKDGGAQGTFSLGKMTHKCVILRGRVFVETACTSAGSATVIVGASTADVDAFIDATSGAVANLVDNATFVETASEGLVVAANETIDLTIGTADLTAGKIKVFIEAINVE